MTEVLNTLVGAWNTEATHPMSPGLVVPGRTTFEWLEGEKFLIQRSQAHHPVFPDSIWVIGDGLAHYFDSRGVQRVYEVSVSDSVLRMSRDQPGFSQRLVGTFSDDGDTLTGRWELSRDDETWDADLEFVYRRAKG
jgi:hypothetical protein